jgi:hypothetical protein
MQGSGVGTRETDMGNRDGGDTSFFVQDVHGRAAGIRGGQPHGAWLGLASFSCSVGFWTFFWSQGQELTGARSEIERDEWVHAASFWEFLN